MTPLPVLSLIEATINCIYIFECHYAICWLSEWRACKTAIKSAIPSLCPAIGKSTLVTVALNGERFFGNLIKIVGSSIKVSFRFCLFFRVGLKFI